MNAPFNLERGFGQMTAEQRIKRHILLQALAENDDLNFDGEITAENIDDVYESVLVEDDAHYDYESEFRCSGEDTGLDSPYSRYYESKAVARQLSDGTWVGWTYWCGGGEYGCSGDVDWMPEAYDVEMHEETRVVKVFARKDVGESQ